MGAKIAILSVYKGNDAVALKPKALCRQILTSAPADIVPELIPTLCEWEI